METGVSIGAVLLYLSDLLFPVWLALIYWLCTRKGVPRWKAWLAASTFVFAQAQVVARVVGWNLGFYTLLAFGLLPVVILERVAPGSAAAEVIGGDLPVIWVSPLLLFVLTPSFLLFCFARWRGKAPLPVGV